MNRSKAKGTATETAAQRWLVADGWPDCERIVQHGPRAPLRTCTDRRVEPTAGAGSSRSDGARHQT